jgi:hypothetical protein
MSGAFLLNPWRYLNLITCGSVLLLIGAIGWLSAALSGSAWIGALTGGILAGLALATWRMIRWPTGR